MRPELPSYEPGPGQEWLLRPHAVNPNRLIAYNDTLAQAMEQYDVADKYKRDKVLEERWTNYWERYRTELRHDFYLRNMFPRLNARIVTGAY